MGTTVIVRQVVKAVAPLPVLAAAGIADGAGLAAALALDAQGVLLGTRFYATTECPSPDAWKQAIVASDGHDTIVTSVPHSLTGRDWPGACSRVVRTRFIEEWLGREPELRRRRGELWSALERAEAEGQLEYRINHVGQCAGLIDAIIPAGDVVRQIVAEAEDILRTTLPAMATVDLIRVRIPHSPPNLENDLTRTSPLAARLTATVVTSRHLDLEVGASRGRHACRYQRHVDGDAGGTVGVRKRCRRQADAVQPERDGSNAAIADTEG